MKLGVCIDGRGGTPPWRVQALGAGAVSLPLVPGYDPTAYLRTFRERELEVLLVLGRHVAGEARDWRAAFGRALDRADELVRAGLVTQLALGQEPDDGWAGDGAADDPLILPRGGVGSWVLSAADLAELAHRARARLGHRVPLWLGGLSSGRAEWLGLIDLSDLDGVLLHPYGDGDLGALLDGALAEIAAQGLDGRLGLGIGELGRSDHELSRGAVADWLAFGLGLVGGRGDVERCYVCCDSDLTQAGYGLFDAEERAKPGVVGVHRASELFSSIARSADPLTGPTPEGATSDPSPTSDEGATADDDELPWPAVLPLSAEALAGALGAPDGDDRAHPEEMLALVWPQAGPHLELYGVAEDRAAAVALLAAIWVATDGRFEPVAEQGLYDRCERLYGRGTRVGAALGNRYHGDGHRFRARGLLPLRGRAAYERYGQAMGLDLVAEPELLVEVPIAMAVATAAFATNGLWEAAGRGDYAAIGRVLDPGLNGYGRLVTALELLWWALDGADGAPEADERGPGAAFAPAIAQVGRPYRAGGASPSGFDAGGLVAWAYLQATGTALPVDPDAIEGRTLPIEPALAVAGDLVLYAYGDPSRAGARFAHVGMVTEREDLVLDSRAGLGVGARPHIQGAVRRYRRVAPNDRLGPDPGTAPWPDPEDEDEDEVMWRERYEETVARLETLAERLDEERAWLAVTRPLPNRPIDKASKAQHVEYGQAMGRYHAHVEALIEACDAGLGRIAADLRPTLVPAEARPDATAGDSEGPDAPREAT